MFLRFNDFIKYNNNRISAMSRESANSAATPASKRIFLDVPTTLSQASGFSGEKRNWFFPTIAAKKYKLSTPKGDDFSTVLKSLPREKLLGIVFCRTTKYKYSNDEIAQQFDLPVSFVKIIRNHKHHILQDWKYNTCSDKCLSPIELENIIAINEVLTEWKRRSLYEGLPITDTHIIGKANFLKRILLLPEFKVSKNWLEAFNKHSHRPPLKAKLGGYSLDIRDIVSDLNAKYPLRCYENLKIYLSEKRYPDTSISKTNTKSVKKKSCSTKDDNVIDVNSSSESDVDEIVQPVDVVDITDEGGAGGNIKLLNKAFKSVVPVIKSENTEIENEAHNINRSSANKSIGDYTVPDNVEKELIKVNATNNKIWNLNDENIFEDDDATIEVLQYLETDSEDEEISYCNEINDELSKVSMKVQPIDDDKEEIPVDVSTIKPEEIEGDEFISIVEEKKLQRGLKHFDIDSSEKSNDATKNVYDVNLKKENEIGSPQTYQRKALKPIKPGSIPRPVEKWFGDMPIIMSDKTSYAKSDQSK